MCCGAFSCPSFCITRADTNHEAAFDNGVTGADLLLFADKASAQGARYAVLRRCGVAPGHEAAADKEMAKAVKREQKANTRLLKRKGGGGDGCAIL